MSVTSKTATAVIALMLAGAYPMAASAQSDQTDSNVDVEVIESQDGADATAESVGESASEAGDAIGQAAEETGETVVEGAEAVGEGIEEGVSEAGDAIDQAAEETADTADQTTDAAGDVAQDSADDTANSADATGEDTVDATVVTDDAGQTGDATDTVEADVEQTEDLDDAQLQELQQAQADGKPVPPTGMLMGVQRDGQWLSSDLIDQQVRNPQGETIGDIGGILFSDQGPDGVIVEVGGFLGIGEKDVAIKWSELTISSDGIVVSATEEQLKNAPEFVSLEEQQIEADLQAEQDLSGQGTGMMSSGNTGMGATTGSAGMVGEEVGTDTQTDPALDTVE